MKPSTFQISGSRVVLFAEDVGLVASLNGNHKLTLLQRVPSLNRKRARAHFRFKYELFQGLVQKQGYSGTWDLWAVLCSVCSDVASVLICCCEDRAATILFFWGFFVHSYPHLWPTKIILQIQAAETVPGLRERNSELLLQQIRRTLLQWFRRLSRNCQNVCGEGFEHVQLGLSPRAFPGKAEEIMSLSWLGWGMFEFKLLPPQPRSDSLFWQCGEVKRHI